MLVPPLDQVVGGWPFALAVAAVGAAGVRGARRRTALNEALHEVRRPLQVLALTAPVTGTAAGELEGPVRMAAAALERLEREINGGGGGTKVRAVIAAAPLLEAAVGRWQARAALAGRTLELRCRCGTATVDGCPAELAQALDNLLANSIEHGGRRIAVTAGARAGRLRIVVRDSGRGAHRPGGERARPGLARRVSGGARHGHGLRIVRRIAAEHGGGFALRAGAGETEAVLELPLGATGRRQAGPRQARPRQAGQLQAGQRQTGPRQAGQLQAGQRQAAPRQTGSRQPGPRQARERP